MAWKLLEFIPLKPFFFGGEKVFSNTHFAKSEYFPQQTQLLGALRLYWLEQNRLMRLHKDGRYVSYEFKETAKQLVGRASPKQAELKEGQEDYFFENNDDLGCIRNLSPMFVVKKENGAISDALYPLPSDIVKNDTIKIAKPKKLTSICSEKSTVMLEGYDVKNGFVSGLGGRSFWHAYSEDRSDADIVAYDEVFQACDQVGIGLEHKQTVEGQFYTKRSYKFKKGYSFACLIDIDEETLASIRLIGEEGQEIKQKSIENGIIQIGADGSMFALRVHTLQDNLREHPVVKALTATSLPSGKKAILLSDAMLDNSVLPDAYFQIVPHKKTFKMIQSQERGSATFSKTTERLLVPQGSIYYFDEDTALPQAKGAYAKMGFNRYLAL